MRKIHDVLRLVYKAELSQRTVAKSLSISRDAVSDVLARGKLAGLTWPLPQSMDEATLVDGIGGTGGVGGDRKS